MAPRRRLPRRAARLTLIAAGATPFALLAAPAHAADSTARVDGPCSGSATSYSAEGEVLGTITNGGAADSSRPLVIDPDGSVSYEGTTGTAIKNHTWSVHVFGLEVMSGGDPNDGGDTESSGDIQLSEELPIDVPGVYPVDGFIRGEGGACNGTAFVKIEGSPTGSAPWVGGIAFTAVGLAGLVLARPGSITDGLDIPGTTGGAR